MDELWEVELRAFMDWVRTTPDELLIEMLEEMKGLHDRMRSEAGRQMVKDMENFTRNQIKKSLPR